MLTVNEYSSVLDHITIPKKNFFNVKSILEAQRVSNLDFILPLTPKFFFGLVLQVLDPSP